MITKNNLTNKINKIYPQNSSMVWHTPRRVKPDWKSVLFLSLLQCQKDQAVSNGPPLISIILLYCCLFLFRFEVFSVIWTDISVAEKSSRGSTENTRVCFSRTRNVTQTYHLLPFILNDSLCRRANLMLPRRGYFII